MPVSGRVIRLDTVDSTNNYAMQRINAASAAHGDVILANRQFAGKGQRGKSWLDAPGQSVLMSIIVAPTVQLHSQPIFLAAIALAVREVLQRNVLHQSVTIKWPNDILVGDKKAAGILIENVVRGAFWQWAVVGIGVNVAQTAFDVNLPNATSLQLAGNRNPSLDDIALEISRAVLSGSAALSVQGPADILKDYNANLYKAGSLQAFLQNDSIVQMRILGMDETGSIILHAGGGTRSFAHGELEWLWET